MVQGDGRAVARPYPISSFVGTTNGASVEI